MWRPCNGKRLHFVAHSHAACKYGGRRSGRSGHVWWSQVDRVDTEGPVPNHSNSCFVFPHPKQRTVLIAHLANILSSSSDQMGERASSFFIRCHHPCVYFLSTWYITACNQSCNPWLGMVDVYTVKTDLTTECLPCLQTSWGSGCERLTLVLETNCTRQLERKQV